MDKIITFIVPLISLSVDGPNADQLKCQPLLALKEICIIQLLLNLIDPLDPAHVKFPNIFKLNSNLQTQLNFSWTEQERTLFFPVTTTRR